MRDGRTSARVAADLFDMKARAVRRDRAARSGPELFLHERAFEDCLDRLSFVSRSFESALLIGCPDRDWPHRLGRHASKVVVIEPGRLWAQAAGVEATVEDRWSPPDRAFDLVVALGTLDTVNQLPNLLGAVRRALRGDTLFIGALAGGDSLPRLRQAMHAADRVMGAAAPHVHPRIEAAALAPLLGAAGFVMPVVDVDRVRVAYRDLDRLVRDLRRMGATNILSERSRRPLSRAALNAARQAFAGEGEAATELFEILHFAAWTPPS
jgi:hypothetical protein